ncbi:MAG: hypothetical protein K6L80_13990 [Agarilytica sp.]
MFLPSVGNAQIVTASDFSLVPPLVAEATDPFVMISLSVELTQQAEAFTGAQQTYPEGTYCPGRTGGTDVCFSTAEEYIGYFDPDKCYEYVTSSGGVYAGSLYSSSHVLQSATGPELSTNRTTEYFRPVSITGDYTCSGNQFSGNFMNWATMTALDEFRYAMTGGARLVDTTGTGAQTVLTRTHRYGDWPFVTKAIDVDGITTGGETFINAPSGVTPFAVDNLVIVNNNGDNGNRVSFFDEDANQLAELSVLVEVCNESVGLEENCVEYTDGTNTWYKPEGVLQQNALTMRYALTSYAAQNSNSRNGGVLRANAKYIGYIHPIAEGGIESNPQAEFNELGQFVYHPDQSVLTANGENLAGVNNSGILNYINSFGLGPNRYKGYDPVGELYYEGLRYIMGLDPTPEYTGAYGGLLALSANEKDNFPVITNVWDDPVLNACQPNYIVGIGDQFSWMDGDLPGTSRASSAGQPSGAPSNGSDVGFNVTDLTNTVGSLEGMGAGLGVHGTTGRENTYYVAGMAYFAVTEDIRDGQGGAPSFEGDQHVRTFFVDTQEYTGSPPMRENNPLWLAAKYGGFKDQAEEGEEESDGDPNNGDVPTGSTSTTCGSTDEWDADGNCDPEAYTLASQPANLIAGLQHAFGDMAERVNAGSAAGVVSNTSSGQGLVVQGLFKPRQTDENGNIVEWGGVLHSLFIDEYDNFREDTDGSGYIDASDRVIQFVVDQENKAATVSRFEAPVDALGTPGAFIESGVAIENLDSVWNSRDWLSDLELDSIETQRSYNSVANASSSRAIYTGIPSGDDGIVRESDVIDFDVESFPLISSDANNRFRLLGLDSTSPNETSSDIVNYIRGVDVDGFRSRAVDFDGDGEEEIWRLGDVVNSSPVIVAAPNAEQRYDLLKDDDSFSAFYQNNKNRRHVVYVGANDGMLHAFNAGFYKPDVSGGAGEQPGFDTTGIGGSEAEHDLGAELWGYVPYNVLPHIRWLTEQSYPHVFYVDGIPQVFEANIFPDSAETNGWGTILVVGMRFGGGEIQLDPNSDDDGSDADNDDISTRSAYIVMDITDPESPPRLIAEISHPMMGYTTSRPTVVKHRPKNSDGIFEADNDQWYLVMGSGPAGDDAVTKKLALDDAVSNQTAKIFVFDLQDLSLVSFSGEDFLEVPDSASAFVGDLVAGDVDEEVSGGYADDAIYFGTVSGSVSNPAGDLMRMQLGNGSGFISDSAITRLVERSSGASLGQPFSGLPFVKKFRDEFWVYTGSGRFFNSNDELNNDQMSYYGVMEPKDTEGEFSYATVNLSEDLVDVEGIQVQFLPGQTNSIIYDESGSTPFNVGPAGTSVSTFNQLKNEIANEQGWFFNFDDPGLPSSVQSLHAGRSDGSGANIAFTEYVPSGDQCSLGTSKLNLVYFQTGTAAPYGATGRVAANLVDGNEIAERSFDFSPGFVRDVEFVDGKITAQGNLGNLENPFKPLGAATHNGRMSWREIQIDW